MGLGLTGNETKGRLLIMIREEVEKTTVPEPNDVVGFWKHTALTYCFTYVLLSLTRYPRPAGGPRADTAGLLGRLLQGGRAPVPPDLEH